MGKASKRVLVRVKEDRVVEAEYSFDNNSLEEVKKLIKKDGPTLICTHATDMRDIDILESWNTKVIGIKAEDIKLKKKFYVIIERINNIAASYLTMGYDPEDVYDRWREYHGDIPIDTPFGADIIDGGRVISYRGCAELDRDTYKALLKLSDVI